MSENSSGVRLQVLVVDDHLGHRTVLSKMLSQAPDVEVVGFAASGEEALVLAEVHRPAVIVMDVGMPGMSGIEATRLLTASLPDVRVIGYSSHELAVSMRDAGAVDFVEKGDTPERLIEALRNALR
ncbi:MAG TPA: response regulator transcription factor [Pirellulaceae bacterium]|jgi:DNA-binding NarL/FixJ family response regulator|nr:response regulator transcription factor [Pirellulaceae bacterium]